MAGFFCCDLGDSPHFPILRGKKARQLFAENIIRDNNDNTIRGADSVDTLIGLGGDDTYYVTEGDTVVEQPNEGADRIVAGCSMTLPDNVEHLTMTGDANLSAVGNGLANSISGNAGNNRIAALAGADTLFGSKGNDTLLDGSGNDQLLGGEGADLLNGGYGNDYLKGETGNDTLVGAAGSDTLYGGMGQDALYGGSDQAIDYFVFVTTSESVGKTADIIYDFQSGTDKITLSNIDADTSLDGNQGFNFNGASASEHHVWYETRGVNLLVHGDTNGDGKADFTITLANTSSVTADDFML